MVKTFGALDTAEQLSQQQATQDISVHVFKDDVVQIVLMCFWQTVSRPIPPRKNQQLQSLEDCMRIDAASTTGDHQADGIHREVSVSGQTLSLDFKTNMSFLSTCKPPEIVQSMHWQFGTMTRLVMTDTLTKHKW